MNECQHMKHIFELRAKERLIWPSLLAQYISIVIQDGRVIAHSAIVCVHAVRELIYLGKNIKGRFTKKSTVFLVACFISTWNGGSLRNIRGFIIPLLCQFTK